MAAARQEGGMEGQRETQARLRKQSSLPDLQGRIIKAGLLEEYLRYRAGYMKWRSREPGKQGGHAGAKGDLEHLGTEKQEPLLIHEHEDMVDTPQKFDFFYTVSYWVAIFTTVGAMVLTFTNFAPLFDAHQRLNPHLMKWLTLIGDLLFTLGAYLNYFQVINLERGEGERVSFYELNYGLVRPHVSLEGLVGIVAYVVGMLVWDVAAVADVFPEELEGQNKLVFVSAPNLIGGFCFVVGGACEVIHNRRKTPMFTEWWAAWFNCVGCLCFFWGVVCGFIPSTGKANQYLLAVGIVCFVVGGVLFIILWRSNDFGLTLLRQLNDAIRDGGHISLARSASGRVKVRHGTSVAGAASPSSPPREQGQEAEEDEEDEEDKKGESLSMRGVFFLVVYCWLLACSSMNLIISIFRSEDEVRHFSDVVDCFLWMFGIMIVLAVHSAITSVPDQQPYKLAMLSGRLMLLLAAMLQTYNFVKWLPTVPRSSAP